ncbi:MAG: RNA methyltransferase [Anaerolineales bacterium]|nr:RNA methyltransferase [Anaerolineales bacterium]
MFISFFEIRICQSCGLRYPLAENHPFGARCPHCLGETRAALKRELEDSTPREKIAPANKKAVLLDNIRSAWNVGSIFRSADGFGFEAAYLCGITPTPEVSAVRKTALGADEFVAWSQHKDAVQLARNLKQEGWKIFALEEDKRSKPVSQVSCLTHNSVLIVGNEVTGVDPELLDLADEIFYIPMRGQKRSFNVANAFSIAAYALDSAT